MSDIMLTANSKGTRDTWKIKADDLINTMLNTYIRNHTDAPRFVLIAETINALAGNEIYSIDYDKETGYITMYLNEKIKGRNILNKDKK